MNPVGKFIYCSGCNIRNMLMIASFTLFRLKLNPCKMELLFIKQCSCPVVMSSVKHYCWGSMLISWMSFWSHSRQQKLWLRASCPASASAKLQSFWGYKDLAITINVILLQCTIHWAAFEDHSKATIVTKCGGQFVWLCKSLQRHYTCAQDSQ